MNLRPLVRVAVTSELSMESAGAPGNSWFCGLAGKDGCARRKAMVSQLFVVQSVPVVRGGSRSGSGRLELLGSMEKLVVPPLHHCG